MSSALYLRTLITGAFLTFTAAYTLNRILTPDRTMSSRLRQLKAMVTGTGADTDKAVDQLRAADVPLSLADCRACPDPCDEGWHEQYPKRFDVDMESQMLGSVKPYARQVVISTGKSDWDRDVTSTAGSLAALLSAATSSPPSHAPDVSNGKAKSRVPGVFASASASRIAILNGSHRTVSDDDARETVLVFPDYTMVAEVPASRAGADALWAHAIDPALGRAGAGGDRSELKTWVLEYSCVILLCSHKRRDNRCAIAAPKLERTFTHALEARAYDVHTQPAHPAAPALEDLPAPAQRGEEVARRLRALPDAKRVLVLRNSHMGGHKFAGNVILCFPQGHSVWYGRVTAHEVEAIVSHTIIGGQVLPALLRGGVNLARPGCATLHDW